MDEKILGVEDKVEEMDTSVKENVNSKNIQAKHIQKMWVYWLVLCVNLTQARIITEKGVSVGEVPP